MPVHVIADTSAKLAGVRAVIERKHVVTSELLHGLSVQRSSIEVDDLSTEIRSQDSVALRPKRERRRTVADDLYKRLIERRESFWSVVYPLFMEREITRANVREVVRRGLEEARGNYKIVARLFNMEPRDYKRFLNFLRKYECRLPFQRFRAVPVNVSAARLRGAAVEPEPLVAKSY